MSLTACHTMYTQAMERYWNAVLPAHTVGCWYIYIHIWQRIQRSDGNSRRASTHKSAKIHAGSVFVTDDNDLLTPK